MHDIVKADLIQARDYLLQHDKLKVVAIKNGQILATGTGSGILPLLNLVDELGPQLDGASVADRVIGRAAAFLLLQAKVAGAFGETLSTEAEDLLRAGGLVVAGEHRVPHILRPNGTERCIMEQQVLDVTDPGEAALRLRRFVQRLKQQTAD